LVSVSVSGCVVGASVVLSFSSCFVHYSIEAGLEAGGGDAPSSLVLLGSYA